MKQLMKEITLNLATGLGAVVLVLMIALGLIKLTEFAEQTMTALYLIFYSILTVGTYELGKKLRSIFFKG